jgi:hypothetical protein
MRRLTVHELLVLPDGCVGLRIAGLALSVRGSLVDRPFTWGSQWEVVEAPAFSHRSPTHVHEGVLWPARDHYHLAIREVGGGHNRIPMSEDECVLLAEVTS